MEQAIVLCYFVSCYSRTPISVDQKQQLKYEYWEPRILVAYPSQNPLQILTICLDPSRDILYGVGNTLHGKFSKVFDT